MAFTASTQPLGKDGYCFLLNLYRQHNTSHAGTLNYSRTPLFRSPRGNRKKFEIAGFQKHWGSVKDKGKSKGIRSSFEIVGTLN